MRWSRGRWCSSARSTCTCTAAPRLGRSPAPLRWPIAATPHPKTDTLSGWTGGTGHCRRRHLASPVPASTPRNPNVPQAVAGSGRADRAYGLQEADAPVARRRPAGPIRPRPLPHHAFSPHINASDFGELVKTLASDDFEGRAPGSPGEDKTVAYITAQMQRIGLQPGNNGSWTQDVSMVETTASPGTVITLTERARPRPGLRRPDGGRHAHRQDRGEDRQQRTGVRRLRRGCARAEVERLRQRKTGKARPW